MVLTVEECIDQLQHAIGGPLVGIDTRRVIDETGRRILNFREWNFMRRSSVTLDQTANQNFIPLPVDFGELTSIEFVNGLSAKVVKSSLPQILLYRSQLTIAPGYLLYVSPTFKPDTNGIPQPQLELFPSPTTTQLASLMMFYKPRWVDLATSDQSYIPVPDWMEPLFIQVGRASMIGYQTNTMDVELGKVFGGPDMLSAIKADNRMQTEHGMIRNGANTLSSADTGDSWYLRTAVLPPVAG